MQQPIVFGAFDDLRAEGIRFLEEAARLGPLTVIMESDARCAAAGRPAKFPAAERRYFLESFRYVSRVLEMDEAWPADLKGCGPVVLREGQSGDDLATAARGLDVVTIPAATLRRFPAPPPCPADPRSARKKVIVTGSFDWFHTGHVRFFEEVSEIGDLYVAVGHDANIRLLKGEGHPLFPAEVRCYIAASIRFATAAFLTSGDGWLDAEPEIQRLQPDVYAVNEDGDKPEKRDYCAARGIEYRVLRRTPKTGLPARQSTALRGF